MKKSMLVLLASVGLLASGCCSNDAGHVWVHHPRPWEDNQICYMLTNPNYVMFYNVQPDPPFYGYGCTSYTWHEPNRGSCHHHNDGDHK